MVLYVYRTRKVGEWLKILSNELKNGLHINITVNFIIVKYRKLQTVHENTIFLKFKPPLKTFLQKYTFLMHFAVPIYIQLNKKFK